jgi:hypothetical protein
MNLVREAVLSGNYIAGWNTIQCDWNKMGNGLYFMVAEDCARTTRGIAKLVLLDGG